MIASIKKIAVAGLFLSASGMALASSCVTVLSGFQSCGGNASCEQGYISQHPECFGGGATTSTTQINATAFTQATAISRAIVARLGLDTPTSRASTDTSRGIAAGGQPQAWNVWGSLSSNDTRISYTNTAGGATRNDTDVLNTVIGGDYTLSPRMTVGASLALDRGDTGSLNGNRSANNGYMIAPYIGYQLNKDLALDASIGFGEGRFSGGGVTADADRWFSSINLTYSRWMDNLQVAGKWSYLHGEEDYSDSKSNGVTQARTASKNKIDQMRLGVQAGYWMNGIMPYAGLSYSTDLHRSSTQQPAVDPVGRHAFVWSLGANFFSLSSKVTGGIAFEQETSRNNSKNQVLMGNANLRF